MLVDPAAVLSGYLVALVAVVLVVAGATFAFGWASAVHGQPRRMQRVAAPLVVAFVALQLVSSVGSVPGESASRLTSAQQASVDELVVAAVADRSVLPDFAQVRVDESEMIVVLPAQDVLVDLAWLPAYEVPVAAVCAKVDLTRAKAKASKCRNFAG